MRIKRTLPVLIAVLAIAAAVVAIVQLRKRAPPEAVRLLPGADGFFYINLKWIRTFNATNQIPAVSHDPEYQKFVEETGFQFERDLDEAGFAIHYPQSTAGSAPEARFSEVFVGKIDAEKLTAYLKKLASSVDNYKGFDIYNVPVEGRTVRVALLSYDSVAVSNHPDENVIRGILDRSRKLASPFGGPQFLRQYYKKVPFASLSWAILKIDPSQARLLGGPTGWALLFPKPATMVISGRYLRALHLRAEAFAGSEDDARAIADQVGTFLNLFHSAETSIGTHGPDVDVKAFFESLKIDRSGDRAILTATVPPGFIKKVLTEAPVSTPAPAPVETPKEPVKKSRQKAQAH
ncbi:MAG TPA: hypothetical protein VNW47_05600 [Terriglobales bacterium]|jgi:hypothetical protein|nr:hypothetical protein [Terriglobales bacterium]